MKGLGRVGATLLLVAFAGTEGCGGGGGSSSSPTASADQQVFEQFTLAPTVAYALDWDLPVFGTPLAGTNYIAQTHASLNASPLNGSTQALDYSAAVSISSTLPLPTVSSVTRYLINGQIVAGAPSLKNVSYSGPAVRVDNLAADGSTIVQSLLRSNFAMVPLSGAVVAAPTEFAQYLNALYYNSALLKTSATWQSGAAYLRFTETNMSDCYEVIDYAATTTGTSPTPVATGTTIAALMQAGGIYSSLDQMTYTSNDGAISTVNGVTTFIATNPRPYLTTTAYHTFYQLNGNVYDGTLIKANATIGGNPYEVAAPGTAQGYTVNYTQAYRIQFNAAAVNSLQAALTF
jgi:hypothetical protein